MIRKVFSLIELITVAATIGILVSLLMPSLHKALIKTKQAACLSNTKQWGIAITQITTSRNGIVPTMALTRPQAISYYSGESLNAEDLNKYLGNIINTTDYSLSGVALCPSAVNVDVFNYYNDPNTGHTFYPSNDIILSTYQYFGQSHLGDRRNDADKILLGKVLDSQRLMLTDFTLRNAADRRWFNHENSQVRLVNGNLSWSGVMDPVGMNRLWGDGRAEWHYISAEDRVEMEQSNPNIPYFRASTDNNYFGSASDIP